MNDEEVETARGLFADSPIRRFADSSSHPRGFTLTELMIVIGIMVLVLGMAIPAFNYITGSRSQESAQNRVASMLGQARQDAIYRVNDNQYTAVGVAIFVDAATQQTAAAVVGATADPANPAAAWTVEILNADNKPLYDDISMPPGVAVRTVANGGGGNVTYVPGFTSTNPAVGVGVILFDGQGRLISNAYSVAVADTSAGNQWKLGTRAGLTAAYTGTSQIGLVVFQREAFVNQGFADQAAADAWINANATPLMVNRYNGTLLKGE